MKLPPLLAFLFISAFAQGATLLTTSNSIISTTVTLTGNLYRYEYAMSSKPLDGKHEVSHVTISLCDSDSVFDAFSNCKITIEITDTSFKFDSIVPSGPTFIFGFYSNFAPEVNFAQVKASRDIASFEILAPSCSLTPVVPEPSSAILLSFIFAGAFTKRRR